MPKRTKPLNSGRKRSWTDSELANAVQNSKSIRGVLQTIGLSPTGGNYKSMDIHIERLKLCTDHFTGKGWNTGDRFRYFGMKLPIEDILIENSSYTSTSYLKRRLINESYLKNTCSNCGLVDWLGEPISLQIEHKNGNNRDNRIENLCILCPNCHSQTPTFAGRNIRLKNQAGLA